MLKDNLQATTQINLFRFQAYHSFKHFDYMVEIIFLVKNYIDYDPEIVYEIKFLNNTYQILSIIDFAEKSEWCSF